MEKTAALSASPSKESRFQGIISDISEMTVQREGMEKTLALKRLPSYSP